MPRRFPELPLALTAVQQLRGAVLRIAAAVDSGTIGPEAEETRTAASLLAGAVATGTASASAYYERRFIRVLLGQLNAADRMRRLRLAQEEHQRRCFAKAQPP